MKTLLLLISLFSTSLLYSQYSDTLSCWGGAFEYVVNYDQQSCTGPCNGNYSITILNGVGPYTYSVTGPGAYSSSLVTDSSLCAGAYTATVTDVGQGFTCFLNFSIAPLLPTSYTLNLTPESSAGACDAIADLVVSGGVPPYTYQWYDAGLNPIPFATNPQLTGLCAGTYYVQYWDNSTACAGGTGGPGSSGSGLIIVVFLDPVIVTIVNANEAVCPGTCTAFIDYTVSGGSGTYIDPFGGSYPECDGGSGTITVCDDQGNCGSASYSLIGWPPVAITAIAFPEVCQSCDGYIFVDDQWSPGTDTYSIDGGATWQSSPFFLNLCPGTYEILATIPDAGYGFTCEISVGFFNVSAGATFYPNLSVSSVDENCANACDGSILVTDLGGDVVSYDIGNGFVPSGTFSGLCSGSYDVWVQNAAGCLSNYGFVIIGSGSGGTSSIDVQTACNLYTWIDGVTYFANNNSATWTIPNAAGCDSIITLNLTISSNSSIDTQSACDSLTWIDGATYFTSNNSATWTLTNSAGCDSVVTLDLTINSNNSIDSQIGCDSFIWINAVTYTSSNNTATHILTNSFGCDSTITLDLILTYSSSYTDVITECDSLTWINGITYFASNNSANWTLTNSVGCDSTITLDLTVSYASGSTDVIAACDSLTWIDGNTYSISNNSATWTLSNSVGCDSTITLDLTINYSSTGTDVLSACDSYMWIDGINYTSSNNTATFVLTNAAGCDSTVTLDLTINYSSTGTDVLSACDSYTWIDGINYTSSNNTATFILTNGAGCDSTVSLDLMINYSSTGTDVLSACDSILWVDGVTYTSSNANATYLFSNAAGCDSVVTLNLTINNSSSETISITALDQYTAPSGAVYTTSGVYSDTIANMAGCDSIITINLVLNYTGLNEYDYESVSISPNPATDKVSISIPQSLIDHTYFLVDLNGKIIREGKLEKEQFSIDIRHLESGMYYMKIEEESYKLIKK